MQSLHYTRLDPQATEIRILHLHAKNEQDVLKCVTETVSLKHGAKRPLYWAVSYCWGTDGSTTTIELNGHTFDCPKSAADVLQGFAVPNEQSTWWMDAICINQTDEAERASQVEIMNKVYQYATKTLVWLGNPAQDVSIAVKHCEEIASRFRAHPDYAFNLEVLEQIALSIDDPGHYAVAAMRSIFRQPYFGRAWVFQELALSHSAICVVGPGSVIIFIKLQLAFLWLWMHKDDELIRESTSLLPLKLLHIQTSSRSLVAKRAPLTVLVKITRELQATEPRDKVFSILGLAHFEGGAIPAGARPNYSTPLNTCMRDLTRAMIMDEGDLDALGDREFLISSSRTPPAPLDSLWPSWVVKWHDHDRTPLAHFNSGHSACGKHKLVDRALLSADSPPNTLRLRGISVDTVESVASEDLLLDTWLTTNNVRTFQEMVHQFLGHNPFPTLEGMLLFMCGGEIERRVRGVEETIVTRYADQIRRGSNITNRGVNTFLLCKGRRLFRLPSGQLGLGPLALSAGDLITVMYGGKWPFALRKVDDHYQLLGPCYLDGFMSGEAFECWKAVKDKPEVFELQ